MKASVSPNAANPKLNDFKYDENELKLKMEATSAETCNFIRRFFKSPKSIRVVTTERILSQDNQ